MGQQAEKPVPLFYIVNTKPCCRGFCHERRIVMANSKDFLCYIPMMTGGSYGRHKNRGEAILMAFRYFSSDWGSMYDVFNREIKGYVAEITGFNEVQFGPVEGIWADIEDGGKHRFELEKISVQMPPLRKNQRATGDAFRRKLKQAVLASQ